VCGPRVCVRVRKDVRRTMSSLSRRVTSLERLRGLAGRLAAVERALHQLTSTTSIYSTCIIRILVGPMSIVVHIPRRPAIQDMKQLRQQSKKLLSFSVGSASPCGTGFAFTSFYTLLPYFVIITDVFELFYLFVSNFT